MISISLIPAEDVVSVSQWKEIRKAYRYELKPTKNQEVKFIKALNTLRHLHNDSLAERKDGWKNGGWSVKYEDQQNHLTVLRNTKNSNMLSNDDFGKELRDVYTDVEQDAIRRVDIGYQRFFERVKNNNDVPSEYKKPGHPRFKGRNRYKSLTFTRFEYGCHILDRKGNKNVKGDVLRLSKIGDIKFIKDKEIGEIIDSNGNKVIIPYWIKTVNVKRYVDKLFVSFSIDTFVEVEIPVGDITEIDKYREIKTIEELKQSIEELNNKCKGHDMGLPNLITSSDGKQIEAPKFLKKSLKRLRREQRRLSRKKIYDDIDPKTGDVKKDPKTGKKLWISSKNREKQVEKVAKIHIHVKNQRKNFSHNDSRNLVNDNYLNIFENLNIQKMMQDRKYARGIADSGWYQLQRFTKYKAEDYAAELPPVKW